VFSVLPLSIVFGTVQVGYSAVETLTVVNTGSFDLEIDSVRSYGAGFGVSPDGASVIAPLDSMIYAVAFSPTAGGAYAGGIVFFSNAESTPDTAEVSGTAQFVAAAAAFAGWNIVSLPVTVPDRRRSAVFPTSSSGAYAYGPSGYSARDTLEYGEGYWLKFPSLQTVQIAGDERDEDTVSLTQGWNVIGSISYPVPVNSITQVPSGLVVSPYFGYTGTGYATTDTIHTMKGYWVKANESGFLILVRP
jgi:hypothetical protein